MQTPTSSPDALRRLAPLLLAGVALLALLPGNDLAPLIDRDEPRFAQATREMIQRGEWVVPYFNDEYRFDKPVLIYWMMRPCYALLGVNEFSARLPSVFSALALALLLYHVGSRWFSRETGFFAGFGFLTCVQILLHGRSAVADMPLILCILAAQYALYELLHADRARYPWGWFWLFYLSLGVGFLAKGPVALAVPILTLLFHRLAFWRRPVAWRMLRAWLGLPVLLAVIGSWGIPALVKTNGEFLTVGIYKHVWARGLDTFEGHGSFFFYYLLMALISLFPWIAFAGDGIAAVRRNWSEKNAFLVSWTLGTYLLFTFYMTKLPHYVLPAFPAIFLLIGQGAAKDFAPPRWARAWFRIVIGLLGVIGLAAIGLSPRLPLPEAYAGLALVIRGGAGIVLCLALLAVLWRRGAFRFLALPLAGVAASMVLLGGGLRAVTPATKLRTLFDAMPPETKCGFYGFREPSLVFYANRRWEGLATPDEVGRFLRRAGPRLAVVSVTETRLDDAIDALAARRKGRTPDAPAKGGPTDLAAIEADSCRWIELEGINIARSGAVKLRVYYRW